VKQKCIRAGGQHPAETGGGGGLQDPGFAQQIQLKGMILLSLLPLPEDTSLYQAILRQFMFNIKNT